MKNLSNPLPLIDYKKEISPILKNKIFQRVKIQLKKWNFWDDFFFNFWFLILINIFSFSGSFFIVLFLFKISAIWSFISGISLNFIAFILILLNFIFKKKRINYFLNTIDEKEIFKIAFEKINILQIKKIENVLTSKVQKYRNLKVSIDSKEQRNSPLFTFQFMEKYLGKTQISIPSYWSRVITFDFFGDLNSGFIEIQLPKNFNDITFSLNKSIIGKNPSKIKLDSKLTKNKINLYSSDKEKTEKLFSQKVIKEILYFNETKGIKSWNYQKIEDKIILNFIPKDKNYLKLRLSPMKIFLLDKKIILKDEDISIFIDDIVNNFIDDLYSWYKLLLIISVIPIL